MRLGKAIAGILGYPCGTFPAAHLVVLILLALLTTTATAQIQFTRHIVADQFDGACSVHAADIDDDGDIDILGCAFHGDDLTLWLNPGDSPDNWPAVVIEDSFDGAHFVNTADLDDDGDLDIVAAAQLAGEVIWWRNEGGEPIVWSRFPVDEMYAGAQQVFPIDMDGDQDFDLVCTAYSINDVSWYRNEGGSPIIWSKQLISDTATGSVSVCVANLDDDTDLDVLTANYNSGVISWWRNDGGSPWTWSEVVIDDNFSGAHEVRTADIDGDGDQDIVGAAFSLSDIKWWRNDGGEPVQWTELMIDGAFLGASSVACADLDHDGDMDVLGAAHVAGDFAWWSNDGGEPVTWTKHTIESDFAEAWPIIAFDIDQDEDLDVLVGARAEDRVAWYESRPSGAEEPSIVTGPGPGHDNPPLVRVFPPEQDADPVNEFAAYGADNYGVNVACGTVGGFAGTILTGAGPGDIYGPHVRGFEKGGTPLPGLSFFAYGTLKYGVNVAIGDLDGNGGGEIITGAGPGAVFGPHVRAFSYDGTSVSPVSGVSFFAYGTPKWGVNVACGDIDGDGSDEIITGAGPGAVYGPHVRGWDVDGGTSAAIPGVSFLAYGTNKMGVNVACGDVDGDGLAEILTAPGPSSYFGAHIRGWNCDGSTVAPMPGISFFAWDYPAVQFGGRISSGIDIDGDGRDDLLAGPGPDPAAPAQLKVFGYDGAATSLLFSLEAYDSGTTHGINAAGWAL